VPPEDYLEMLQDAGFVNCKMLGWTDYRTSQTTRNANFIAFKPGKAML
jgi:hypothetical protein